MSTLGKQRHHYAVSTTPRRMVARSTIKARKLVTMTSREGHLRNMRFTSCNVERALGSVSSICRPGHTVVFNAPEHPDGSYIYNLQRGERMELEHKDGVFVLDTRVAPSNRQANPFVGQGR